MRIIEDYLIHEKLHHTCVLHSYLFSIKKNQESVLHYFFFEILWQEHICKICQAFASEHKINKSNAKVSNAKEIIES